MGLWVAILKRHLSFIFFLCSVLFFILAIIVNLNSGNIWLINPFRQRGVASVLNEINKHRKIVGLKILQEDPNLCCFANQRLDEIVGKNDFSHRGFEPLLDKKPLWYYVSTGENLARDFKDSDVVDAWLSSPEHRKIIETKNYTHGCVEKRNDVYIFTTGQRITKKGNKDVKFSY